MRVIHRVQNGKLVALNQEPTRKKSKAEKRKEQTAAIAAKRRASAARAAATPAPVDTVERDTAAERHARAAIYYDFTLSGLRHLREI